jgi:hypothetical protein
MTDVVEIAKERQARLAAEVGRLDDFICMAEALVENSRSKSNKASDTEDEETAESTDPGVAETTGRATVRPVSAAADGKDAEEEREDLSTRELKAGERVGKPRTIHNEPAPERRRFFRARETA